MNFDALKNEWQQQQAPEVNRQQGENSLAARLRKTQRKILFSNIFITIGLIIGLLGVGWGWIYMPAGNTAYLINLLMVSLLIVGAAIVLWTRLLFWKKPDFSLDSRTFIQQTLRRLKRTPWITRRIIPIYTTLLFIFMVFHTLTSLAPFSATVKWVAISGLVVYFVVVYVLSMRWHRRKQRSEIEPLIQELEKIAQSLS